MESKEPDTRSSGENDSSTLTAKLCPRSPPQVATHTTSCQSQSCLSWPSTVTRDCPAPKRQRHIHAARTATISKNTFPPCFHNLTELSADADTSKIDGFVASASASSAHVDEKGAIEPQRLKWCSPSDAGTLPADPPRAQWCTIRQ